MSRSADDIILLSESEVELENVLSSTEKLLRKEFELKINKIKTEVIYHNKSSRNSGRVL